MTCDRASGTECGPRPGDYPSIARKPTSWAGGCDHGGMHADPNASVAEGQAHPRLHGRCIVCVGFADWETPLWTNQHHLMSRLALTNQVLFVESLGLRQPTLAGRDVSRMIRRVRRVPRGRNAC